MSTITTTLTESGYKKLITSGLLNSIVAYDFSDNTHIYTNTAEESLILPLIGSHNQVTSSKATASDYRGVFPTTPTPTQVVEVTSRKRITFTNNSCSTPFEEADLVLNINVSRWFNALNALTTYSTTMSPGLNLNLISYVTAYKETLNTATQQYGVSEVLNNLLLSWKLNTSQDEENIGFLSPIFVTLNGTQKEQKYERINNGSPFALLFVTNEINGLNVNNTGLNFSFAPTWGYYANNAFVSAKVLENLPNLDSFDTVYPAAKVGNNIYTLRTITPYPTTEGLIGYAINMFNVDGSGETLLSGLISAGKLFFKTYVTNNNSVYSLPISLTVNAANNSINSIQNTIGGHVTLNFIYDENDTSTNSIIYI
jgi:hypothetical protein